MTKQEQKETNSQINLKFGGELSKEKSLKIASTLIQAVYELFQRELVMANSIPEDEEEDMHHYHITTKNIEILVYDSPDSCGYFSILPDYDQSTYVFTRVTQFRQNGIPKYRMYFGFDILKMTFLELFALVYINTKGYVRECHCIEEVEKFFKGEELKSISS